jgi:hypothetical protein
LALFFTQFVFVRLLSRRPSRLSEEPRTNSPEVRELSCLTSGFTKLTRLDYLKRAAEGSIINNGSDVKVVRAKGPLAQSPLFTEAKIASKKK